MKNIFCLLAITFVVFPLYALAQSSNGTAPVSSIWFQCKANTDCAAVKSACNKWEGVNKKYAKAFKATLPKIKSTDPSCPPVGGVNAQKLKGAKPECVANFCAVLLSPNAQP